MSIATVFMVAKVAGYAATAAVGWYAAHKAQIAALARAAEELGPDVVELFTEIRAAAGK